MEDFSSNSKGSLRKIFKNLRLAIKGKSSKSKIIIEQLASLEEFIQSNSILFYYSSSSEVSTKEVIVRLLLTDKDIYLPSTRESNVTLINKNTAFIERIPDILEPKFPSNILPSTIDLAILPGLAFDRRGYRLGYGGGWYDKVLEKLNVTTIIGLCFHEQLVSRLPTEGHDKPVDIIVTDTEVIRVK